MTDEQKIKNIYLMDRAIRALNNEDALYDSWLSLGVADGDTDDGFEKFRETTGPDYLEDYDELYNMYKRIINDYKEDGILTRDWFKAHSHINWKWNAGADKEILDFVKQDFPNIPIIEAEAFQESDDSKCCICGTPIGYYGNNADPVCDGRCCDKCNDSIVIPYRIYLAYGGTKLDSIEDIKKIASKINF